MSSGPTVQGPASSPSPPGRPNEPTPTLRLTKKNDNNFEEDNDWPQLDVGNLIIDLDEDLATNTTMSSKNKPAMAGAAAGGSSTQVVTEQRPGSPTGAMGNVEKSLKMKIKRTKTGARNSEGKLEIVSSEANAVAANGVSPNGSTGSDKMAAAAAPAQTSSSSGKLRLTNSGALNNAMTNSAINVNKPGSPSTSKFPPPSQVKAGPNGAGPNFTTPPLNSINHTASSPQLKFPSATGNGGPVPSTVASSVNNRPSCSNGASQPPAKKQKLDASVGTEMGTMTEPDCLGPLEPGTSVTLEGIVWHETEGGVLVINVTWRGKTYVGTLLDSTRHVNQWAPPRFSDSPTSELDQTNRTPKGRGKRGGRGGGGTPVEPETRKNLRSSKGKGRSGGGINFTSSSVGSPAKEKRKGRSTDSGPGSGDDCSSSKEEKQSKRQRTNDSPDDDEDSEKEGKDGKENDEKPEMKKEHEELTPKDKEEKYVPPPPLPYAIGCPKPGCKKKYRQHNGLRFHVSHSHPELMNEAGEIRDTSEIEKMESVAKEKLKKQREETETEDSSASSSKTSTPGPNDPTSSSSGDQDSSDKSVSAAVKQTIAPSVIPPMAPVAAPMTVIPSTLISNLAPIAAKATSAKPQVIRPPINARPIVPAPPLGQSALNMKPIQPRPTIMADPTPNLSLDELRRKKEPKKKKETSPGTSPPRGALNNGSPSKPAAAAPAIKDEKSVEVPAKSPAYSDISDDSDENSKDKKPESLPKPPQLPASNPTFPFAPFGIPTSTASGVPTSKAEAASAAAAAAEKARIQGPQPGTVEYQKMLQAYGFPPYPYPIPPNMDPAYHVHLLSTDPSYKARYEKERAEKEKAFKDQIDRDNREKDRKAGVKIPERPPGGPEDLSRQRRESAGGGGPGTISVKSEFRSTDLKTERPPSKPSSEPSKPPPTTEEGSKPTMETRGPPPSTANAFGYLHPMLRPPFGPGGLPFELPPGVNPALLMAGAANPYGPNPYLPPHLQSAGRPPFGPGSDLLRNPFVPPSTIAGLTVEDLSRSTMATKALDLLQQHASQYYSNHKIHELQERALKSPSSGPATTTTMAGGKASPSVSSASRTSQPSSPSVSGASTEKDSPAVKVATSAAEAAAQMAAAVAASSGGRPVDGRSPPPLRHVHTHTHTHFGLGYPLLPPGVGGPPAAHSPFPSSLPSHLLPGKLPFPPPK